MMASSLMLINSLTGVDTSHQMAFVQQALSACSDTLREIASQSAKLVATASLHGPEISTILNLALEHGALSERALLEAHKLVVTGNPPCRSDAIESMEGATS